MSDEDNSTPAPEPVAAPSDTQLDLALRRIAEEEGEVDPQAAVARFGSAW